MKFYLSLELVGCISLKYLCNFQCIYFIMTYGQKHINKYVHNSFQWLSENKWYFHGNHKGQKPKYNWVPRDRKNYSLWWCCIHALELKEKKRLLTLSLTVEFALMLASWANFLPYFNPSWSAIYLKKKIHGVKMLHVKFIKHLSNTDKHRPTCDRDKIFVHRLTTLSSWTSVCRRGADHIKVVTASIIPSSQYLLSIFHIWTTFNNSSWKL